MTEHKREYNKLVRDRIPEIIKQDGQTPYTHTASGLELEKALWKKVEEEIKEFQVSKDPRELADILEVIYALANFYGVKPDELESIRKQKAKERGGFCQNIILERVE